MTVRIRKPPLKVCRRECPEQCHRCLKPTDHPSFAPPAITDKRLPNKRERKTPYTSGNPPRRRRPRGKIPVHPTGRCATRQSKKDSTQMQADARRARGWACGRPAMPRPTSKADPDEPRRSGTPALSACSACICLHLRKNLLAHPPTASSRDVSPLARAGQHPMPSGASARHPRRGPGLAATPRPREDLPRAVSPGPDIAVGRGQKPSG
jgi:hypothetical protein